MLGRFTWQVRLLFACCSCLCLCSGAFEVLYLYPRVVDRDTTNVIRVATRDILLRHCGTTAVIASNGTSEFICEVLECFPSFLTVKVPPAPAAELTVTFTIAGEREVAPHTLVTSATRVAVVSTVPAVLIAQPAKLAPPLQFTLLRSIFPAFLKTCEYASSVIFALPSATAFPCSGALFTDVPERPELVVLSCTPEFPEDFFPHAAVIEVSVVATISPQDSGQSYESQPVTFIAPPQLSRFDPAPELFATAAEPRALALLMRAGTFAGTVPLCASIQHAGAGTITIDDAATVFAPDFVSIAYTSLDVAAGPATLYLGTRGTGGACVPVLPLPELTVSANAPPLLRPVLAAYPSELDPRAFAAGAVLTLRIAGGVPHGATATIGSAAAKVVSMSAIGCSLLLSGTPVAGETLASIVIRDGASQGVIAHAPAPLQLLPLRDAAVFDVNPPVLPALGPQLVTATLFLGTGFNNVGSCVVWHCGVAYEGSIYFGGGGQQLGVLFTGTLQPGEPLTFEFHRLEPSAAAALLSRGARVVDGGYRADRWLFARHLITSHDLPVMNVVPVSLTPSWMPCQAGACTADAVVATFAAPLPFPLRLGFGETAEAEVVMEVSEDGTILTARGASFAIPQSAASASLAVSLIHTSYFNTPGGQEVLIFSLPFDILLVPTVPHLTRVVPPAAALTAVSSLRFMLTLSEPVLSLNNATMAVTVGPYAVNVTNLGPFFLVVEVSNGGEPFDEDIYDVSVSYRGEHFFVQERALEFFMPPFGPIVQAISPLWLLASEIPEEVTLSGSEFDTISSLFLIRAHTEEPEIPVAHVIVTEGGKALRFVVVLTLPGTYDVFLRLADGSAVGSVAQIVASDAPRLSFMQPNSTIAIPKLSAKGHALAELYAEFSAPTSLQVLPVELFAIFDVDGDDASAIKLVYEPISEKTARIRLLQRADTSPLPGTYRVCFRSPVPGDAEATTREFLGPGALLTLDKAESVPYVLALSPPSFYSTVYMAKELMYRSLVISLANGAGNMPSAEHLVATIDGKPSPVLFSGGNFVVLQLPVGPVAFNTGLAVTLVDALTSRSAVAVYVEVLVEDVSGNPVQAVGLRWPRVYIPSGHNSAVSIEVFGLAGLDKVYQMEIDGAPCDELAVKPTKILCRIPASRAMEAVKSRFTAVLRAKDQPGVQPAVYLSGEFVPPITIAKTELDASSDGVVRVTISYTCGRDLSLMPLVPRLVGAVADISDISLNDSHLSFTARRSGGSREATVELYDVAVEADPARAEVFAVLDGVVVVFADPSISKWAIALIVLAALAGTGVVMFLLRKPCLTYLASCTQGNEDDDADDFEYDDIAAGDAASNVKPYHSLN